MIKITHHNHYIQTIKAPPSFNDEKECTDCGGNGWIYEFYNDPVSWRKCPHCVDQKEK